MDREGAARRILDHMSANDPLQVTIRAHLYIEALLTRMMEKRPAVPTALDMERLNYERKVRLAAALGTLPGQYAPAYLALGSLRNKFGHDVEFEISNQSLSRLLNAMNIPGLRTWEHGYPDLAPLERLRGLIEVLYRQLRGRLKSWESREYRRREP